MDNLLPAIISSLSFYPRGIQAVIVIIQRYFTLLSMWPGMTGIGSRNQAELVAGIERNRWPGSTGICNKSLLFQMVWEKAPLFVLSIASSILTLVVQKQGGGVAPSDQFPLHITIPNALVSYVNYIQKMLWPDNLSVFYPYPEIIPMWKSAGAGLLLLSLSILFTRAVRARPYLIVGWLWYLGTLIPVIGLIQVGNQAMADRYTYIPLIGPFIMITWGIADVLEKWRFRQIFLAISICLVLSALTVCTWIQIRHWRDSSTIFSHALEVTAKNYLAHNNLGSHLMDKGEYGEAIRHYSEAANIKPGWAMTHYNLGNAKARQGKYEEAIGHYYVAVKLKPNYAGAHNNLANMLLHQEHLGRAIRHYLKALEINPDYANAHSNLGIALTRTGDIDGAVEHFKEALRINPDDFRVRHNLEQTSKQQRELKRKIN